MSTTLETSLPQPRSLHASAENPSTDDRDPQNTPKHNKNGGGSGSRPVSFYDNCLENRGNGDTLDRARLNGTLSNGTKIEGSPTLAYSLITTVPQNIASPNIAHKHTPTRNSLRHSRMIALTKNGRVPRKYLPAIIRYHKLAKSLLGLTVLLGAAICVLALWLSMWTPNLRQRDNPYWSGIPVFLSGVVGLILLCCCRKEYPGMKRNYVVYSLKVLSIFLSVLGAVTSFCACAFSILHLISIYTMTCTPPDKLDTTCICRAVADSSSSNQTRLASDETTASMASATPVQKSSYPSIEPESYHYVDLSCVEVENILTILVLFSCATNFIAGILEVWYVYLHWASRYTYTYSKVLTDEQKPTVLANLK